jgi:4-alpha-glucanotransferase
MASRAAVVIIPMQDVLGLGTAGRMNIPGSGDGNWQWRLPPTKLDKVARELRLLAESFDRTPDSAGMNNRTITSHQT